MMEKIPNQEENLNILGMFLSMTINWKMIDF